MSKFQIMELQRPIARFAFFGALFGSLFVVGMRWDGSIEHERVFLAASLAGRVPMFDLMRASMIPILLCTVWAVAVATRWWPLAGIVGFALGQMLVHPLLDAFHVSYAPYINVEEAASMLMVPISLVAAGVTLSRPSPP